MSEPIPHTADGGERLPRDWAAELGSTDGRTAGRATARDETASGATAGRDGARRTTAGRATTRDETASGTTAGRDGARRTTAGRATVGRRTTRGGTTSRAGAGSGTTGRATAARGRRQTPDDPGADRPVAPDGPLATDTALGDAPDDAASSTDRPEGPHRAGAQWPVAERSLMATVLGVPPVAAVGVAAAFTTIGVAVDLLRTGTLGTIFLVCYLTGCVLATAWVRRSGVFWPMVAPPLLMASAVPVVVLLAGTQRPGAGVAQRLLVIGAPLVNGFPMMAWTTGLVLVIGVFRLVTQRIGAQRRGRDAARAGGRTSTSPPRS